MNKLVKTNFKKAILTVPDKFLEKGVLNLVMKHFFEINKIIDINKHAFYPVPKVNSKVLEIKHKKLNLKEELLKNVLKEKINLEFLEKRIYQMNFNEWEKLVNALGL